MKTNLLILFISIIFCLALVFLAELCCRLFADINFLGNSENLFISDAYGTSKGNAKNIEGISFGVKVYTDENGFRIDPDYSKPEIISSTILIMGDSVGFGAGVPEDKTFAGLLRKAMPDTEIDNSSVIGYCIDDYKNIVDYYVVDHEEIDKVYLLYCLNDIQCTSSKLIDEHLQSEEGDRNDISGAGQPDVDESTGYTLSQKFKDNKILQQINSFLRSRSKLYLFIKGNFFGDLSLNNFLYDLQFYSDNTDFEQRMSQLSYINDALKMKGIDFTVLIAPYEAQLRYPDQSRYRVPQALLTAYFDDNDIRYIDTTYRFQDQLDDKSSRDFFLYRDAAHFSELGHKVIFDIMFEDIKSN